ncbi:MAG TPA: hypothetical protein VD948_09485 [Rhodothermales bacterium]|nr:hypothetical protein [Rhodothermales bacterium]
MPASRVHLVARLMWIAPALLLVAGLLLLKAPLDLGRTLREGTPAVARVLDYQTTNRTEVSYDALTVRVPLPAGDSLTHVIPLPRGIAPIVGEEARVPVRVLPGAVRPVVIESAVVRTNQGPVAMNLGRTQIWIAGISSAMCLLGALLLGIAVGAWNRYLARHGDPGERTGETTSPVLAVV